jgi:5-methyltetrahydrofolate--homocysteine methyltransferase
MPLAPSDSAYLQALSRRVLVYDGAMGTNIQRHNLTAEDYGGASLEGCNDHLVLTRPEVIQGIHESFLAVGCDVVETCTFQSTPRRLEEWGLGDKVREINVAAARLARAACDAYATPEHPRFVAASIGPTGMLPSSSDPVLSQITFAELADNYYEQAKYLLEGGVDVLLVETSQDILEVKAAVAGFERLFAELGRRVAVQAQITLDTSGRMLLGTDIASAMTTLEALPIDVLGLKLLDRPRAHARAGALPHRARHPPDLGDPQRGASRSTPASARRCTRSSRADGGDARRVRARVRVRIVGGCCGTTPEHLRQIVAAVRAPDANGATSDGGRAARGAPVTRHASPPVPRVSSAMRAITLHQDPPPLLVGERLNSQGSRKVKRLLLSDDYEALLEVARDQVDAGAHVLDVCVALTERADEAEQMARVVKLLSMSVETPLMIDSTEAGVIERALEHVPGRAIVNSINMENGRKRFDEVVPLVKKHGAAVVALTIDPVGMAKTRERKLEVARAIFDICVGEYGLAPGDLIYDALTFTLATATPSGSRARRRRSRGFRLIKARAPRGLHDPRRLET